MKQKDIDIYEILKDEEYGTELYTPKCGRVWHSGMANDKDSAKAIWTEDEAGREHFFYKNGKIYKEGEILLFPSKEMRDWSKFFKKGDVLVSEDGCVHIIFEKFVDYTYTKFIGKHYFDGDDKLGYSYISGRYTANTKQFRIEEGDAVQTYIKTIEEKSGGKLNRETLEIEKPEKLTFEIGKLYVFDEEDEDGKVTVIGKLIGKEEGELTIGNQYEIENEKFVTDEAFFLNISLHKELREATEDEAILFQNAFTLWKKSKNQPSFRTFDKVLVRNSDEHKWRPAIFARTRIDESPYKYNALLLCTGHVGDFIQCIPYKGNENMAFTTAPF